MKKAEAEKNLLEYIKDKGLESYMAMQGEGRQRNNTYYQFTLKGGTQRHWTNPSDEFLRELGID